jgi:hypothetical protein
MPKGRVAVASGWTFGHVEVRSAAAPILPTRPASRLTRGRPKKGRDLPAEIIRAAERELHAASIICRQPVKRSSRNSGAAIAGRVVLPNR